MANLKQRVSALEAPLKSRRPYENLTDNQLDGEIDRTCVAMGTKLEKEIERHGGKHAFIKFLRKELVVSDLPVLREQSAA